MTDQDMTDHGDVITTCAQLRALEIAGNLRRITAQLSTPDPDPRRLHEQLLLAQHHVLSTLIDLNAIIGTPASMPPAPARDPRQRTAA